MKVLYSYIILIFLVINTLSSSEENKAFSSSLKVKEPSKILGYLQREQTACSLAQQNIVNILRSKNIPIGLESTNIEETKEDNDANRIAISTEEHPLECRISLGPAPSGTKCIAPCGCSGSQKWIQFSLYNRLRRKDPQSWKSCQTCKQPYRHDLIQQYSGLTASIIGLILDKIIILRVLLAITSIFLIYLLQIPPMIIHFLASPDFWQMFPAWIKIANLQIVLKIWIGKLLLQYAGEIYLQFEKNVIVSALADIETNLIEANIPNSQDKDQENIVEDSVEEEND